MSVPAPHFLLYSQAAQPSGNDSRIGHWKFVLRRPGSEESLEAADEEPEISPERLELLAIFRGLEALDERSRVTLVEPSRSVQRGLEFGLTHWRENDWQWERYGRMVPVKDGDLWRRLDHALKFHRLECRKLRVDRAHGPQLAELAAADEPESAAEVLTLNDPQEACGTRSPKRRGLRHVLLSIRRQCREKLSRVRLGLAQFGTGLLPRPWLE
jgi:ribonuclease HI